MCGPLHGWRYANTRCCAVLCTVYFVELCCVVLLLLLRFYACHVADTNWVVGRLKFAHALPW